MKKETKIHDLTWPVSNLRPLACEASDVPLRHSGEGLDSQKYWMYTSRISKTKAGIVENDSCNQETTGKNFEPHSLSVLSLLILIKKLKTDKFLLFGPVKMI